MCELPHASYLPINSRDAVDHWKHYLNENVEKAEGYNHNQKDRRRETNSNNGSKNGKERSQERHQGHRNLVIDCADILGEAVYDPPQGSGLKKRHGRVHDINENTLVKIA